MGEFEAGSAIVVTGGMFQGFSGTIVAVKGELVLLNLEVLGRVVSVEVQREHVRPASSDPREGFRDELRSAFRRLEQSRVLAWWGERAGSPEVDPLEEHDLFQRQFERIRADVDAAREGLLGELDLAYPEAESVRLGVEGLKAIWADQRGRWLERCRPQTELDEAGKSAAFDRWGRSTDAWRAREIERRKQEARQKLELPASATRDRLREEALLEAQRLREPVRQRVLRTHGLELPDSVFDFWQCWRGLSQQEQEAWNRLVGLSPVGVLDLCLAPGRVDRPRARYDDRLVWRFYRDPPEFLTVAVGNTDGLHWGLWYDLSDRLPDFVASYYNNDSVEIRHAGSTLLEAARAQLEFSEFHLAQDQDSEQAWLDRAWLEVLRQEILRFETASRPECGESYTDRYCGVGGDPRRLPTYDGLGVWMPERRPIEDGLESEVSGSRSSEPGPGAGGAGFEGRRDPTRVASVLRAGDAAAEALIERALQECRAGQPGEALALARDCHCLSDRNARLEQWAHQLFLAAYTALGRGALAAIAEVHHRFRSLPQVDSYSIPD